MIEISHAMARRLIRKQADARLPEEQWAVLHGHLEACQSCRDFQGNLTIVEKGLRRALKSGWDPAAGPVAGLPRAVTAARAARARARRTAYSGAALLALIGLFFLFDIPGQIRLLKAPHTLLPEGRSLFSAGPDLPAEGEAGALARAGDFPDVVVFEAPGVGGAGDLYLLNPGAKLENLTHHPAADTHPAWSPDGEWIAFLSDRPSRSAGAAPAGRPGRPEVYVTDAAGVKLVQLTDAPGVQWQGPLSWSRDGQWIALTGVRTEQGNQRWVYLVALDGSGARALDGTRGGMAPKFARTGEQLAFSYMEDGRAGVRVYHLTSGTLASASWPDNSLYRGSAPAGGFDWSRDGSALAYIETLMPGERPSGDAAQHTGSQIIALRNPGYAVDGSGESQRMYAIAESRWTSAFRAVTWSPAGAVVYLESLDDARARQSSALPSGDCWQIQTRTPAFRVESGSLRQVGGLCVESGIDGGSWTPDGRWLVAFGRLPGESALGLYAVRMTVGEDGPLLATPTAASTPGAVLRLADVPFSEQMAGDSLDGVVRALPRTRPRLHAYEEQPDIHPRQVRPSQASLPPSDLTARAGGPAGQIVYVMQNNGMSVLVSSNPNGTGGRVLYASQGSNRCARWSPDGEWIALVSRMPATSGTGGGSDWYPWRAAEIVPPAPAGLPPVGAQPDGAESAGEAIYVLNAAGGQPRRIPTPRALRNAAAYNAGEYGCPVWSPEGAPGGPYLAALVSLGKETFLAVLPVNGGAARYAPVGLPVGDVSPVWSPDGRSVYLVQRTAMSYALRLLAVTLPDDPTGGLTNLALSAGVDWDGAGGLAISPEDPYLAAYTPRSAGGDVTLALLRQVPTDDGPGPLTSGRRAPLALGAVFPRGPQRIGGLTWLPEGHLGMVLYSLPWERAKALIGDFDLEQQKLIPLAQVEDVITETVWSPDGRWLLYAAESGLWGLDVEAARAGLAAPVWLSPVPIDDIDWR